MDLSVIEVDSYYRKLYSLIFKMGLRRASFEKETSLQKEGKLFNCLDPLKLRQRSALFFPSLLNFTLHMSL